jgi:hypothetical protein
MPGIDVSRACGMPSNAMARMFLESGRHDRVPSRPGYKGGAGSRCGTSNGRKEIMTSFERPWRTALACSAIASLLLYAQVQAWAVGYSVVHQCMLKSGAALCGVSSGLVLLGGTGIGLLVVLPGMVLLGTLALHRLFARMARRADPRPAPLVLLAGWMLFFGALSLLVLGGVATLKPTVSNLLPTGATAAAYFACAIGLWRLQAWGLWLARVLLGWIVVSAVLALLSGGGSHPLSFILNSAVAVWLLVLLSKPGVRALFPSR